MGIGSVASLGHLIDGQIVRNDRTFPVDNPSNGQVIADCPAATAELLDTAMAAAERAQPAWFALGTGGRQRVLQAMAETLAEKLEDIVAISALEKGALGAALEAYVAPSFVAHRATTAVPVDVLEDTAERSVTLVRKPVGVVAAIAPWNAPILIACEKIATALLVGNTVVAKPSPFTPLATLALGDIWKDVVPPGVLNILAGDDSLGALMVAHPTTRLISFTGSVTAGHKIAEAAGRSLKRTVLELGGNDAAIVLSDVDVDAVAPKIFGTAFLMGGQVCAAIKRLYVHESIYEDMVRALTRLAEAAVAAPEQVGGTLVPLTTRPQFDRVRQLLDDALNEGAHAGGGTPRDGSGYFVPATILTDVHAGMRVVDEEQFGPLLPVIPFGDVEDAIAAANDTQFGLCGSVWTADVAMGEALAAAPRVRDVLGEQSWRSLPRHPIRRHEELRDRPERRDRGSRRLRRAPDAVCLQVPRSSESRLNRWRAI